MRITIPVRKKKARRLNFMVNDDITTTLDYLVMLAKRTDEKASRTSVIESLIKTARIVAGTPQRFS